MVWNAIAGIAGAAASIFGGSDEPEETVTRSEVDYKQMVKSAQKAGINPLTALRNGGAAGFAAQTTTQPALASESLLSRLAQGTGLIAEGLSNQQRWEQSQQRSELENRMIQAQINTLENRGTGSTPMGNNSPRVGGTPGNRTIPGADPANPVPAMPTKNPHPDPANTDQAPPGVIKVWDPHTRKYIEMVNPKVAGEPDADWWYHFKTGTWPRELIFKPLREMFRENTPLDEIEGDVKRRIKEGYGDGTRPTERRYQDNFGPNSWNE